MYRPSVVRIGLQTHHSVAHVALDELIDRRMSVGKDAPVCPCALHALGAQGYLLATVLHSGFTAACLCGLGSGLLGLGLTGGQACLHLPCASLCLALCT